MSSWIYFIPRNDVLVRVAPRDEEELRLVRTELELLKRVRIHVDNRCRGPRRKTLKTAQTPHFSLDDLTELRKIVHDANRSVVEEMIELFDAEHKDVLRKLDASSIDQEARQIAQNAKEAGVITHLDIHELESGARDNAPTVAEALAAAEAELAQALANTSGSETKPDSEQGLRPPDQPPASIPSGELATNHAETPEAEPGSPSEDGEDPQTREDVLQEFFGAMLDSSSEPASKPDPTVEDQDCREIADVEDGTVDAQDDGGDEFHEPPDTPEPSGSDRADTLEHDFDPPVFQGEQEAEPSESPTPFDAGVTPERAERVVTELEDGLRKLTSILGTEVNAQWQEAKKAFDDILSTRDELGETKTRARSLLEEISAMRDSAHAKQDGTH